MVFDEVGALEIGVALLTTALLFGLGLGCGLWLRGRGDRKLRERAATLEAELASAASALSSYRGEVEKHFGQTSDLFRDLTRQYTTLYAHLAEGARDLCVEQVPELGRGLAAPLLGADEPGTDASGDAAAGSVDAPDESPGEEAAASP